MSVFTDHCMQLACSAQGTVHFAACWYLMRQSTELILTQIIMAGRQEEENRLAGASGTTVAVEEEVRGSAQCSGPVCCGSSTAQT